MYVYLKNNRYETTTKNTDEANEMKADGTGALNGFEDQDPFASNKAKEAFNAPMSDPFGSAFPAQQSNVSSLSIVMSTYSMFSTLLLLTFSCSLLFHSAYAYIYATIHKIDI